ncbi:multiple coagulation factor deficiency protein 2 homolog [Cydia amplana]|uniref:multiple coagulation factor deficiency protein 2 homolog n=1 Tax=Cydia amplana TaxID=1869771 RepID=UPI002FE60541
MIPGQVDKNHATYTDKQLEDLLEHVLKHTDIDKDGYVDYLEYRVSSYKARAKAQGAPKTAGAEGVKVESPTVYSDDDLTQIVEGALGQADKDNDGFITYAEFRDVASPH